MSMGGKNLHKLTLYILATLLFAISLFIALNKKGGKSRSFTNYKQVPAFIQQYFDSCAGGKFLIAEKGENWSTGCVLQRGKPACQFVNGLLNKEFFKMNIFTGGIGGPHESTIILDIRDGEIVGINKHRN
jgi:hypothetical protein